MRLKLQMLMMVDCRASVGVRIYNSCRGKTDISKTNCTNKTQKKKKIILYPTEILTKCFVSLMQLLSSSKNKEKKEKTIASKERE